MHSSIKLFTIYNVSSHIEVLKHVISKGKDLCFNSISLSLKIYLFLNFYLSKII